MAKTKTTPNYEFRRCPMCSYSAKSEEDYREHVFKCAMRTFQCPSCDFSNNKEANLKRHVKRCHPGLAQEDLIKLGVKENRSEEVNEPEGDHEWLSQDPGDLIGDVSDNGSDEDEDSSSRIQIAPLRMMTVLWKEDCSVNQQSLPYQCLSNVKRM